MEPAFEEQLVFYKIYRQQKSNSLPTHIAHSLYSEKRTIVDIIG